MNEKTKTADAENKVVARFGGRHLIFRTNTGEKSIFPKPYALISSFRGPSWFFYGIGQVFLTHEKLGEFENWMARIPRTAKSHALLEKRVMGLEPELSAFIGYCNEHEIEGTIVLEESVIEFHWTFGHKLEEETQKCENKSSLESHFGELVDAFVTKKE